MKFEKYHGTGNDFIMIDFVPTDPSKLAKKICDRHFGIGADGLIYPEPSKIADIKFNYFNSDGSIAPMCGNGMRCFVKYVLDQKMMDKHQFDVETLAGIIKVSYQVETQEVKINLGLPEYDLGLPHVSEPIMHMEEQALLLDEGMVYFYTINLGTLHTIVYVDDYDQVKTIGPALSNHPFFPRLTNVNFVHVKNHHQQEVNTFERGAGWTLSCGTGVAASAFVSFKLGKTSSKVDTIVPGGKLKVYVEREIYLEGPATKIASGTFEAIS